METTDGRLSKMSHNKIKVAGQDPNANGEISVDLSNLGDVNYTAGPSIDNYILTFDSTTNTWGAEVNAGGGTGQRLVINNITTTPYTLPSPQALRIEEAYFAQTGASAITLFSAVGYNGFVIQIKNLTSSAITITPNGSEQIDGSSSFSLNAQYESVTLISDNSNWFII